MMEPPTRRRRPQAPNGRGTKARHADLSRFVCWRAIDIFSGGRFSQRGPNKHRHHPKIHRVCIFAQIVQTERTGCSPAFTQSLCLTIPAESTVRSVHLQLTRTRIFPDLANHFLSSEPRAFAVLCGPNFRRSI